MLSWEQPRTVLSLEMCRPETALSLLAGGEMRLMAGVGGEIPTALSLLAGAEMWLMAGVGGESLWCSLGDSRA